MTELTGTRAFSLGDVLSVTTGYLVSLRHVDGLYDILNYMTGDDLYTPQLPRALDECAGPLLTQHPDLAAVRVPEQFGDGGRESAEQALTRWLSALSR